MDKIRTKQVWLSLNLPTPRYARLSRTDDVDAAARWLGLPVIVKPACEGSSVGVSRVFKEADLPQAVALAARYEGELLMEQLIEGEEFTVGILRRRGAADDPHRAAPASTTTITRSTSPRTRSTSAPACTARLRRRCARSRSKHFAPPACSGWGRVDVMRDRNGANYLLEVNTAPGMTSHSLVPKAAKAFGIEFDDLVWRILETSFDAPNRERRP